MSANNRKEKDVQGTSSDKIKKIKSINQLRNMTVSNKDYNHKHGQSTAFDGLRAVMLNIKVFWDVTLCRRVHSYNLPADTAVTT